MTVSFKKPPINEVALGYTFLVRPDLLIPHLGRFWAEILDVYPNCQHALPIVDGADLGVLGDLPLPRIWFVSADNTRLVQLQQDRLIFNWRDVGEGRSYVRFPAIRAEFERVRDLFQKYVENVTGQPIVATGYNLTYVNIIRRIENWSSVDDVSMVFPDLLWRGEKRFLPRPIEQVWKAKFALPNDFGTILADVQPAKLAKGNDAILKFELTALSGSLGGRPIDFGEWVQVAHDWIVHSFTDLTGDEMHSKVWLLDDGGE